MPMSRLEELQHAIVGLDETIKTEIDVPSVRHKRWFLDVTYDEKAYVVIDWGAPWKGFTLTRIDDDTSVYTEDTQEAAVKAVELLKEKRKS